jgi:hypothetical protein
LFFEEKIRFTLTPQELPVTRFLVVIGAVLLALKMIKSGALPLSFAAIMLLGVVFLAANGSRSIGFILAAAGVLWLAAQASGGDIWGGLGLLGLLLPLLGVLFGFYVMFGGLRGRRFRVRR